MADYEFCEDECWYKLPGLKSGWIHLGVAPIPRTVPQTIVYHVANGLLMHYPIVDVLSFSWRNRRSFVDNFLPQ